jgi:hypothetical protein
VCVRTRLYSSVFLCTGMCACWGLERPLWGKQVVLPLMFACKLGSIISLRRGKRDQYIFYHSMWHHLGAIGGVLGCGATVGHASCDHEGAWFESTMANLAESTSWP